MSTRCGSMADHGGTMCVCVCVCVCMTICMYVCTYACTYIGAYIRILVLTYLCMVAEE